MLVRSRLVCVVGNCFLHVCLSVCRQTVFPVALLRIWFCWFGLVRNEILQSLNPKDRERESRPCVNLHQERLLQLPSNCVKLRFVSCTSNLLTRTFDFRKCREFHPDVDFESSKSPAKSES